MHMNVPGEATSVLNSRTRDRGPSLTLGKEYNGPRAFVGKRPRFRGRSTRLIYPRFH